MALTPDKNVKLYYSIKEVAEMFGVAESLLRYWETQFPTLKPKVGKNNVRQYSESDIKQIRIIHNLVKVRGFKLANARKMINKNPGDVDKSSEVLTTLISLRDQLTDLKKQFAKL